MWIVACAAPTPLRRNLNPSSPLSPWPSGRATSEIPSASATSQPFKVKGERGSGAPFSRFTETRFYAAADRAAEHRSGPGPRATDGQADSGSHGGGTCAAAATPVGKVAKKKDRKIRTRTTDSGSSSSSLSLSPLPFRFSPIQLCFQWNFGACSTFPLLLRWSMRQLQCWATLPPHSV